MWKKAQVANDQTETELSMHNKFTSFVMLLLDDTERTLV